MGYDDIKTSTKKHIVSRTKQTKLSEKKQERDWNSWLKVINKHLNS